MRGSRLNAFTRLVRTLQILVAAMSIGCILFLVIAILAADSLVGKQSESLVVTSIALGYALASIPLRIVVPRIIVAQSRRKIREGRWPTAQETSTAIADNAPSEIDDLGMLAQVLLTQTIIAAAILEGAIFFLLVAYLVERSPLSLMMAAVLIVAIAASMPTTRRCYEWIKTQKRLLDEERSLCPL
jgi:hypothetical protein